MVAPDPTVSRRSDGSSGEHLTHPVGCRAQPGQDSGGVSLVGQQAEQGVIRREFAVPRPASLVERQAERPLRGRCEGLRPLDPAGPMPRRSVTAATTA